MAKIFINEKNKKGRINPEIYGHFSEHLGRCIYEGLYVGENSDIPNENGMRTDVVEALREMQIPVLRWPGGCFADEYHWKDGIGPKETRKKMINTHWGGVVEDNSFGTHEFFELCRQLGCKTYVNGNVGSGTVQEMSEWVEYITFEGLRWPGGCFADEYHWKDGIGPKETRKKMINTHWGGVVEDNSFGTHEFFELCRQLGCKTYVNGNVGSGTVQEMSEWVEYITFEGVSPMADLRKANGHEEPWKIDYFGVGNENWGCGGNMRPEYYADLYRRYQTYVRQYHKDAPIYKVCGGPNVADYDWTTKVLDICSPEPSRFMNGLSLHYYVHPGGWDNKGSATQFNEKEWYNTLERALYMEELVERHGAIMDQYDPEKKIGLIVDEWGGWFDVEPGTNPGFLYQQNTMRDALIAGITLNIFNKHCDRVKMACIAQMVNVLQSVILTEGAKMIKTPTYHVFHMYKHHQGAELVDSFIEGVQTVGEDEFQVPDLQESVSVSEDGTVNLTLNNLSVSESREVEVAFTELHPGKVEGSILTQKMNAYNTFEEPEKVKEEAFTAYEVTENGLKFTIPACSVVLLRIA